MAETHEVTKQLRQLTLLVLDADGGDTCNYDRDNLDNDDDGRTTSE